LINLEALGLIDVNLEKVKTALKGKYWMILIAWPTWSWKSTTMFWILKSFNPLAYNISTLEDPVEYNIEYVNQSQVKPEIWYSFSTGLRSIVRQDPDIIMVWEIRDKETAILATEAALTWHLVFSTIHTNSAAATIQRLINMWVEPFLIASAMRIVISQRLWKKICPYCKKERELNEYERKRVNEYLAPVFDKKDLDNAKFYQWTGCEKCSNTGYMWRLGFHEIMIVEENLEPLILAEESATAIWNLAVKNWMITIIQDALIKALMWQTTIEEALQLI
jgi:type IV pilus assembly protein PilB